MRYIKQLLIILFISFLGEMLGRAIPLSIPASVYGIVILFTALFGGIIPLKAVEDTADFLLSIMAIFFIPAGAGIMTVGDLLMDNLIAIIVITVVSTVAVIAVTGLVSQTIIKKGKKND